MIGFPHPFLEVSDKWSDMAASSWKVFIVQSTEVVLNSSIHLKPQENILRKIDMETWLSGLD